MASKTKAQAWLAHSKAFGSPASAFCRQATGSMASKTKAQAWLAHSKAFGKAKRTNRSKAFGKAKRTNRF